MPNKNKDHGSDSESEKSKHDSGSGSDGEEEEYVVEKVVDKRIVKGGKVCLYLVYIISTTLNISSFDFVMADLWLSFSLG